MAYDILRELIRQAVRDAAHDAGGVLLSGGVDSSSVACIARELATFTGFYDGEPYDERRWASLAKGARHHEIRITPEDFVRHFDAMREAISPPYAGPGTFGQYMVARYVAPYADTVLTGEGGDELFGGYARLMIVAGEQPPEGYEDYQLPADYPRGLRAALNYDWQALPTLTRADDQVAAAHRLRVVAPLLDPRIVEYVLDLPSEQRVGKRLLKQAMRGIVPDAILARRDKRGFPVPFVDWAQREPVGSFVRERIGYVPDPAKPWDRRWWLDMLEAS